MILANCMRQAESESIPAHIRCVISSPLRSRTRAYIRFKELRKLLSKRNPSADQTTSRWLVLAQTGIGYRVPMTYFRFSAQKFVKCSAANAIFEQEIFIFPFFFSLFFSALDFVSLFFRASRGTQCEDECNVFSLTVSRLMKIPFDPFSLYNYRRGAAHFSEMPKRRRYNSQ